MNIDKLRKVCAAATPGPWFFDAGNGEVESRDETHWRMVVVDRADLSERFNHCRDFHLMANPPELPRPPDVDCEFVATFNPDRVAKMLAAIEVLLEIDLDYLPRAMAAPITAALAALEETP